MAQTVKQFPKPIMDWDNWLNGEIWQIKRGTDFESKPTSFRVSANKEARKRGMRLRSQIRHQSVYIQAMTKGD